MNALTDSTKYTYRFVKFDESQDIIGASDTLSIVTEKEFQIPNSNFESCIKEKGMMHQELVDKIFIFFILMRKTTCLNNGGILGIC